MTMLTPKNPKVERLPERVQVLEAVLDLDPEGYPDCNGDPLECDDICQDERCPLRHNRLQELGSIVMTLLDEFEWHRAWAEELIALGMVPPNTMDRVQLRIDRRRLQAQIEEARRNGERLPDVQAFQDRIRDLEVRIGVITAQIGEDP